MQSSWAAERAEEDIIRLCHSGLDSHSLRVEVFRRLERVMPYEAFWCATTDPATLLFTDAVGVGFEAGFQTQTIPAFVSNEFLQDDFNKFTDMAKGRSSVTTLQLATHGDLGRSRRFREILEPDGFGHEMRAVFRSGGAVWGAMCLHRHKRHEDFTPAHVAFFAAIAPHIAAGLRGALLLDAVETAPATDGPGLLLLAEDHSIIATTPSAELLLNEISDWSPNSALPLAIHAVVAKLRVLEHGSQPRASSAIPRVRLRTRAGRWVTLHASRLSSPDSAGQIAVMIELATPNDIAPFVLQGYALTAREQEVATLVLKGHSTEAIAAALVITTLTVQQHLKAIFDKVGVRSRRELVAQVFAQSYWPALAASQGVSPAIWSPA
jgi:DNA-binding CsgD family transcriptional regulator